jgi:hypothetical protein
MLAPEYRASFGILRKEIGLIPTLKISLSSIVKSKNIKYKVNDLDDITIKKNILKNHFTLFGVLYEKLVQEYGEEKTLDIMHEVLKKCGPIFMRGFKRLGPNEDLSDFIPIYKKFESKNLIFDVIEESPNRFEIIVKRCLIYEAFKELGLEKITPWMCDIAFIYFQSYHQNLEYSKDQMIARGDEICHEVYIWEN